MDWTFIYLLVVLKIPILLLGWIIWWSIRSAPDSSGPDDDGGQRRTDPPHPRPPLPRAPRRGPHHDGPAPAPRRVRSVVGRVGDPESA